jgi:hypothetical protein
MTNFRGGDTIHSIALLQWDLTGIVRESTDYDSESKSLKEQIKIKQEKMSYSVSVM